MDVEHCQYVCDMKTIVAPSLLSCDFSKIAEEAQFLNQSDAEWFHLDVMDGVFVPNISFGLPIIKAFREHTNKFLDVHAMIANPDPYIADFSKAGADMLTVHIEACPHAHRTIGAIKQTGMKAGIALNPHTPLGAIEELLSDVDMVLIMSVNPGFGGQSFIPSSIDKVKRLRSRLDDLGASVLIEVDGGVNVENAKQLCAAGANVLVAGSSVYKSEDPAATIRALKNA